MPGPFASIRTDIAAFVGIAQRGPLHKPIAANSWKQFQATFGTFISDGYLAYSANAFFQNGGQRMYAVRVAAPSVSTSSNPSAVQPADGSASVVLNVQGFAPGALVTVQQTATGQTTGTQPSNRLSSAVNTVNGFPQGALVQLTQPGSPAVTDWHRVQAVDPVARVLSWESPLIPGFDLTKPLILESFREADSLLSKVDPGSNTLTWASPLAPAFNPSQPMQFDSGAGASHGTFYDAMGNATLGVRASSPGTWGDGLAVELAQTSLEATATTSQAQPASGAFSYVQSVAGFLLYSVVKAYQSGVPVAYRLVEAVDFSANALTWDSPLPPAFNLGPHSSISFETVEFSLTVYLNGQSAEIFPGLSPRGE